MSSPILSKDMQHVWYILEGLKCPFSDSSRVNSVNSPLQRWPETLLKYKHCDLVKDHLPKRRRVGEVLEVRLDYERNGEGFNVMVWVSIWSFPQRWRNVSHGSTSREAQGSRDEVGCMMVHVHGFLMFLLILESMGKKHLKKTSKVVLSVFMYDDMVQI